MSELERKERLKNLCEQINPMPEEQENFIIGFMEGVRQMAERHRKEAEKE